MAYALILTILARSDQMNCAEQRVRVDWTCEWTSPNDNMDRYFTFEIVG